jgi:hypothetical protein
MDPQSRNLQPLQSLTSLSRSLARSLSFSVSVFVSVSVSVSLLTGESHEIHEGILKPAAAAPIYISPY